MKQRQSSYHQPDDYGYNSDSTRASNRGGLIFEQGDLPTIMLPQIQHKIRGQALKESARMKIETTVIKNLIQSYFDLTKINIQDLVPKTIMAFLVNESKKKAQAELVDQIYKQGDFD